MTNPPNNVGGTFTGSPSIPLTSNRTVYPMRNRKVDVDVVFLDKNYYAGTYGANVKGYWHTGVDYNGRGGKNTDLGDPLFAIRDGVIEFVDVGGGTWGNVVVLRFQVNGKTYWARYGHVRYTNLQGQAHKPVVGQAVKAGALVAYVGQGANNQFYAHLHFDIFHTKPPHWGWWPTRYGSQAEVTRYCEDPQTFLKALGAVEP